MLELEAFYPEVSSVIQAQRGKLAKASADEALAIYDALIIAYRFGAVGALLIDYDAELYRQALAQSGALRLQMLKVKGASPAKAGRYLRSTRSRALFDSLAGGHREIAVRIATLTPRVWQRDFEYEEDYLYVQIVHATLTNATTVDRHRLIERFEEVLDGTPSARLDVCEALVTVDQEAFDEAFASLLREWTRELLAQEKSLSRDELAFCADRYLFHEGLALLACAESFGLHMQDEYRYCPREARLAARDS